MSIKIKNNNMGMYSPNSVNIITDKIDNSNNDKETITNFTKSENGPTKESKPTFLHILSQIFANLINKIFYKN